MTSSEPNHSNIIKPPLGVRSGKQELLRIISTGCSCNSGSTHTCGQTSIIKQSNLKVHFLVMSKRWQTSFGARQNMLCRKGSSLHTHGWSTKRRPTKPQSQSIIYKRLTFGEQFHLKVEWSVNFKHPGTLAVCHFYQQFIRASSICNPFYLSR